MPVIIENMGPTGAHDDERFYRIRVNQDIIARFTHRRGEGLAACLRKAADAVEGGRSAQ